MKEGESRVRRKKERIEERLRGEYQHPVDVEARRNIEESLQDGNIEWAGKQIREYLNWLGI